MARVITHSSEDGERPFDRLRVVPSEVEGRSRTMRRWSFTCLFFLFIFLSVSTGAIAQNKEIPSTMEISLKDVIRLVLENSLDIQIAKLDAYLTRESLPQVESIFDTVINMGAGTSDDKRKPSSSSAATRARKDYYSLGLTKKLPSGTVLSVEAKDTRNHSDSSASLINPHHEAEAEISLTQSLGKNFFGIADRSDIKITMLDIENCRYTSLNDIETALYDAMVAYWDYVFKKENVKVQSDILKEARKLYGIYKDNYSMGLVETVDLIRVESQVKQRQNDLLAANLDAERAKNNLLFLLNQDDLSIGLEPKDYLSVTPERIDLYLCLIEAIKRRRDYKRIKNNLKSADIDIKTRKNSLWPEIDLKATFSKNGLDSNYKKSWEDIGGEDNSKVFFGIEVQVPLENRMAKSKLKQARMHKQQLILKFKRIERLILKEVYNQVKTLNSLKIQVEFHINIAKLQEEKLKAEMKLLKQGRSGSDIIIRYENDLLKSRLALAAVFFNYRVNLLRMDLVKNSLLDRYWKGAL